MGSIVPLSITQYTQVRKLHMHSLHLKYKLKLLKKKKLIQVFKNITIILEYLFYFFPVVKIIKIQMLVNTENDSRTIIFLFALIDIQSLLHFDVVNQL